MDLAKNLLPALAAVIVASGLQAQSLPPFEVASVKPHNPSERRFVFPELSPSGKFSVAGLPMFILIAVAYDVPFQGQQLSGGPDWIRSDSGVYDIEAKAEEADLKGLSAKQRQLKMRQMLQALLADRFKLAVRREVKEQPVYILTVAKNGPKPTMSRIDEADCESHADQCHYGGAGQGRGIHAKGFDMAELCVSVSNFTDKPLIDRTGLKGLYDIDTDGWVPMRQRPIPPGGGTDAESQAMADPTRPTLYMIFEKLGLKMEPSKAPVESIVIERVERPTGN
ncbi:MAG TPA: TIGR03435 family protein [Bryobacteraceae bacterium]|nr:TIGR03435 family protein [Bryobacteraceae bacterium]